MGVNKVGLVCAECVQELAERLGAVETMVAPTKKAIVYSVELRLARLEFVLTVKNSMMCPPGTLFVRIFPLKNNLLSLHLYELLGEEDFRCCYFPYNSTPEQLRSSFAVLTDLLLECLPAVESLALDSAGYEAVLREKCERIAVACGVKLDEGEWAGQLSEAELWEFLLKEWDEFYETFYQLLPFTQDEAYAAFVVGDLEKARRKYRKLAEKGKLQPYFQRLYAFLQTPAASSFEPLPESCGAVYIQGREQQYGVREGLRYFAAVGVCYAGLLPLYFLVGLALYGLVCGSAEYAPFEWVMLLLLPLMPAVFGAMSLRRWLYPRLFRKNVDSWLSLDAMENSNKVNVVSHALFGILMVVCLFFTCIFIAAVPRFYTDRMVYDDAAKFPFLNPVTYAYEDIERVCYIEGRWNVYDELVERGSYILLFADGTAVDLDSTISEKQTVEQVLPLLESYIDEVELFPSDRELVKKYGTIAEELFTW